MNKQFHLYNKIDHYLSRSGIQYGSQIQDSKNQKEPNIYLTPLKQPHIQVLNNNSVTNSTTEYFKEETAQEKKQDSFQNEIQMLKKENEELKQLLKISQTQTSQSQLQIQKLIMTVEQMKKLFE
ncbi:Hypothetical_protein [Hexamita inflata]|uniref:Hypothetical_protein n=1 Tax=Hexamita inflata TaxID=28002 RepID=A0AA86N5E0_9EUKA|nr:Hypothetical protein HINF_LOCUS696 [Hexamita inflata]CAI9956749.1 Hypothetical protein HINF_LOCUS44394 [Hexamita inflata]